MTGGGSGETVRGLDEEQVCPRVGSTASRTGVSLWCHLTDVPLESAGAEQTPRPQAESGRPRPNRRILTQTLQALLPVWCSCATRGGSTFCRAK